MRRIHAVVAAVAVAGAVGVAAPPSASAGDPDADRRCTAQLARGTDGRVGATSRCYGAAGNRQRATVSCSDGTFRSGNWTSMGYWSRVWCPKGLSAWGPGWQ